MKELEIRKLDYKEYIKSRLGKEEIPYSEENFNIVLEEVCNLREHVYEINNLNEDL